MAPAGYNNKYLLKPAPSFEVNFIIGDPDKHFHFGFSLGYCNLKPTQDTFKTYALGSAVLPGYEVIHDYEFISIGMRNEFTLFPDKKISPVLGIDLYMYVINISDDYYAETLIESSVTNDNYWSLAILPRIGLQYKLNDNISFTAGIGRSMSFTGIIDFQSYWKTYIGIKYFVN